jgi:hypothetical protein
LVKIKYFTSQSLLATNFKTQSTWRKFMTSTTQTDLASLRAIAEEGRYTPLAGGRFLIYFGGLVATANVLNVLPGVTDGMTKFASIGFPILAAAVGAMVFLSLKTTPRSNTLLAQAEALVWSVSGIAIGLYMGILTLRALLGLSTPPNVMGALGAVAFLHYGVAFFTTAGLSKQKWVNIPAGGSFVAAIITGVLADTAFIMPITSVFVILLAIIPGIIMIRAERKA